jgi:hypothetical protein
MIHEYGRTIACKKNIEEVPSTEDRLNRADASRGQPTDRPQRADTIAYAELVYEVRHSTLLALQNGTTAHSTP